MRSCGRKWGLNTRRGEGDSAGDFRTETRLDGRQFAWVWSSEFREKEQLTPEELDIALISVVG